MTRAGCVNNAVFFANQAFSSAVVGSCAVETSSARNSIFWAIRRLTIVSSLSRPIASASR